jgi:hypothetical protein
VEATLQVADFPAHPVADFPVAAHHHAVAVVAVHAVADADSSVMYLMNKKVRKYEKL